MSQVIGGVCLMSNHDKMTPTRSRTAEGVVIHGVAVLKCSAPLATGPERGLLDLRFVRFSFLSD